MKKLLLIAILPLAVSCTGQEKRVKNTSPSEIHQVFDKNGNVKRAGKFDENGKKTGEWKYYFEDGTLQATVNFVNGISEGEIRNYYFRTGKLWEIGHYKNGKKAGEWKAYHKN